MVGLMETEFAVVATAENGLLALKLTRKYQPDIVVLDLRMPLVNGIEVARHLTKSTSKPCIVICSADTEPEIIQLSRQAGALAYVFKLRMGRGPDRCREGCGPGRDVCLFSVNLHPDA